MLAVFNTLVVRTSGNDLVGPGAMSTYSGGGGRRRPTSYVRVKDPAVGFFVAGSSEEGLNGLYGRTDKAPPGASASDVEISYRHLDTGWFMALRRQRTGDPEWVFVDPTGHERLVNSEYTLIPGSGQKWRHAPAKGKSGWFSRFGRRGNGDGGEGGESRPRESKAIDITREMLAETRWSRGVVVGRGANGSAKAFVETVMHGGGGDDDESRVLGMVRDRQGSCHTGDPRRSVAGQRQDINRFHDERATKRAYMDKLIGLKRQATARRDHSTVRTHQADIIRVRGEIEELTARINKLAAVTFKTDRNVSLGAIDLHGFTTEGAREKFIAALGAALELNGGLEVIVGKGSHSGARGGVIGPMVKKMLNRHEVGWESEGGKVVIRWA